jgi:hypothetical protein
MRNEVDIDRVTSDLYGTIVATLAPIRMAVWVREGDR